jgi:hypothetical protein
MRWLRITYSESRADLLISIGRLSEGCGQPLADNIQAGQSKDYSIQVSRNTHVLYTVEMSTFLFVIENNSYFAVDNIKKECVTNEQ